MNWSAVLAKQTGFSPDVFEDILYVVDGQIIHVLWNIVDRNSALKSLPKQNMTTWPRGQSTHRFKCMCGRLVPIEKGLIRVTDPALHSGGPCRHCLYKLPAFMCDKALLELVGMDEDSWINVDSLKLGRLRTS